MTRPPKSERPPVLSTRQDVGYDRLRDLPRLLRLWPEEVRRLGANDQAWLVTRLAQGLRAERQMGLARHWSYDLTRHAALLRAWRTEQAVLRSMEEWEGRAMRPAKS